MKFDSCEIHILRYHKDENHPPLIIPDARARVDARFSVISAKERHV